MKLVVKSLILATIISQVIYASQQSSIDAIDSTYEKLSNKTILNLSLDSLKQLEVLHKEISDIDKKSSTLGKSPDQIQAIFKDIKNLERMELEQATVFITKEHRSMISNIMSSTSNIANSIVKIDSADSLEVIRANNLLLGIQNDLMKCNSDYICEKELKNREGLLLGIKSLFLNLKGKEKAINPGFFEKLFDYDPEMSALRKTIKIVNDKKVSQKHIANLFEVAQPTISNFLNGSNSKKLLSNFYAIIKPKNYLQSDSTEMEPLLTLKEKKLQ